MKTREERHEAYIKRRPGAIRKVREWQMANPAKVSGYKQKFNQANPMAKRYYNLKYKSRAEMELSIGEFYSWYDNEPKRCFYCDIPLDLLALNNRYTNHQDSNNLFTIDRKDNTGNYTKENIALACPLCNLVKSNFFEADTMRELAQRYIKPRWQQKAGIEPIIPEILIKDDDQSLPDNPFADEMNQTAFGHLTGFLTEFFEYRRAQQDMLKENWVKVKEK